MQLKLAPERLDQRRERALVASLGPLEIDGHRINDTRSADWTGGPFRGIAVSLTSEQPRIGDELMQKQRWGSALTRVFAPWRTGLPRPVLVLQGGSALNNFGTGLILPFEIIYLHAVRGFSTATAGLVLATVMGTAAVVTLPSGALLDRFSAKRILIAGTVLNALGYGGLAFVERPWQGFVCSAVGGAGFGLVGTAGQVLTLTLVRAEQRAASTALRRVAGNFGLGLGATVAGFIVAAADHHLQAFQALYLFDAVTFVLFARSCSSGSRILASRMLRRRARSHGASELLLGIGSCSP